ncbi:MAG: DUF4160 domain-containing protein [Lewinellaceae bacterium]|nr:DUF4160 domain-containing protein [Lewinellaceae bacterium]
MPTIFRQDGFRFFFYSNDHEPVHVHVEKGDAVAKYNVSPLMIADNFNFSANELRRIRGIIFNNQDFIIDKWNEYFNNK